MRILVQSINYAPELTGIGKYTSEMCGWLAARGHEVRVITAPPYYPEWCIRKGYRGWSYRREVIDGVRVERCPIWVPANPSGAKRLLHLVSFALFSLPLMLRSIPWRPQVVIVIEPPLFCAPGAWLTARLSGGKAWLHVQDLEVDAAFSLGILPPLFKTFVTYFERAVVRRFDAISTISVAMRERLILKVNGNA
jgi:colanic acid biosynthesis glycosyl transferase WcaI